MSSFEHTDSPFAANPPPLSASEPTLPFVCASCGCFPSGSRQDDATNTAHEGRLFISGRGKAAIRSGELWCAVKDLDVAIKARRPQRHVRRSGRMDRVRGDDLMLAFLNRHELAKLRRLRDLALPNRFRVGLEEAQHLIGHVRVTAEQPGARLCEHTRHQWLYLLQ